MKSRKPNLWQVLMSVLGALFGIQSSKVYERDFTQGHRWWVYICVGIGVFVLIIITLILTAKFLVST